MVAHLVLLLALAQGASPLAELVHRAQEDFQSGRYSEARAKLQEALKLAPKNAALWSYLGLTDSKLNNTDAAIADFEKGRALEPRNPQTHFNLGLLYRQQGDPGKAIEAYQRGLALDPEDSSANQNFALLLMEAGRFRDAVVPLGRLKGQSPSTLSIRVTLIETCLKGGLTNESEREIREFLQPGVASPEEQLKLAKVLVEDKQPEAALEVLNEVRRLAPNLADGHAMIGRIMLDKSQFEEATQEMGKAVQLSPDTADYSLWLAEALLLWKHYHVALEFLTAVKEKFGKLPEYRYKMGLAYYGMHQYPLAITQLEGIAREQPNLDRVQFFLGNSYLATGELQKSEASFRRAIALNPQNATYYSALAQLIKKESDTRMDEAIQYLQKSLELDPSDAQSKQELALCYEKQKNYSGAERLLLESIQGQPDTVSAHVALARVYYREGKKQDGDRERKIVSQLEAQQQSQQTRQAKTAPPSVP